MKRNSLLRFIGFVAVIVVAILGWYLLSPLFIDDTVDEAFPFEVPNPAEMEEMTSAEKADLEDEFMAAVPGATVLESLSDGQRQEVEERVFEAAATVMQDKEMVEPMPEAEAEWLVISQGVFEDADAFHQGSGTATLFQQGESRILRFEEFSATNGPDLHVILTRHPAPAGREDVGADYVDLGPLKGNVGNQNYPIPNDLDLVGYQGIVIYCMPFHVVFATATLS